MAGPSIDSLVRILLRKTPAQVDQIAADAEQVALGAMTSISLLSQTTQFDADAAGRILEAVERVRQIREANPDATATDIPGSTLGHSIRFSPVQAPQGTTWGP